jgi:hypothetical protein
MGEIPFAGAVNVEIVDIDLLLSNEWYWRSRE